MITKKDFKRKLTKVCLNPELIAGREIFSGEGSLLTNTLCPNCTDKNETIARKILARSKVELFPAQVSAETNIFLPDICFHCVLLAVTIIYMQYMQYFRPCRPTGAGSLDDMQYTCI